MSALLLALLLLAPAACRKEEPGERKDRKVLFYRHPMDPKITSPTPAKDDMGMDFIPVYEGAEEGAEVSEELGRATVTLSTPARQLVGVRLGRVERRRLEIEVRAFGRAAYDPELYHAQEEYLSALELARVTTGTALVQAAETRLKLLGLSESQLARLRRRGKVDRALLLGSLESGRAWVYAEIFESDLGFVKVGQEIEVTSSAYPGQTFSGAVVAIDPTVDPKTRTTRLRSEIRDPRRLLKPDLYVDVLILAGGLDALVVPKEAVLDSGRRQYVFVAKGEGRFEPRKIRPGRRVEEYVEVLEGLQAGEEVVVSGNFLIDSESQLKAAVSAMTFFGGGAPKK